VTVALALATAAAALQRPPLGVRVVFRQPQLKDSPEGTQGDDCEKREDVGRQQFITPQVELNSPAKPMNAMDRIPAMIRLNAAGSLPDRSNRYRDFFLKRIQNKRSN